MKLYLIRHGQTLWNQEGKIQGKTDIPLNDEGRKQAGLLAEAMENRPVGAVYSSPLKRAFETASCVAEHCYEHSLLPWLYGNPFRQYRSYGT